MIFLMVKRKAKNKHNVAPAYRWRKFYDKLIGVKNDTSN